MADLCLVVVGSKITVTAGLIDGSYTPRFVTTLTTFDFLFLLSCGCYMRVYSISDFTSSLFLLMAGVDFHGRVLLFL